MHSDKSAENYPICASSNKKRGIFRNWRDRIHGATAIEYAMLAAAISLGIATIVFVIGDDVLNNMYQRIADLLSENMNG